MQLIHRMLGVVRRNPSKAIAAISAANLVAGLVVLVTSVSKGIPIEAAIGFALIGLLIWAAIGYLMVYRMWFSPSRRLLVVILVLSMLSDIFLVSRDGIASLTWWGLLVDVGLLGLGYLAWFEPRVLRRSQSDPVAKTS